MSNRTLKLGALLMLLLPAAAAGQSQSVQSINGPNRVGSWEITAGGGVQWLDGALRDFLGSGTPESRFADSGTPGTMLPVVDARIGYNVSRSFGFSIGAVGSEGAGIKYFNPSVSATLTGNINAKTNPFLMVGTEFTRIMGQNRRLTHSTWGAHAGVGVRQMLGDAVALRLDGMARWSHYNEIPMRKHTTLSPMVTAGLSFFTQGRKVPTAVAVAPAPMEMMVRTDTVRIVRVDTVRLAAVPRIDYVCDHGMAPVGAATDSHGCLIFGDSLLLEGVHFDTDKSNLSKSAQGILDRVAQSMLAHPDLYFEIAGHTDNVGTNAYNYRLSQRRAAAVRDYLIGQSVPGSHMTAVGYGEEHPIAPNATIAGRAENRRGVQLRVKRPS